MHSMSEIFTVGLLCGATGLVALYSLLIGRAYRDAALYTLAVTLAVGMLPVGLALPGMHAGQTPNLAWNASAAVAAWLVLALASWALGGTLGGSMGSTGFQRMASYALLGTAGLSLVAAVATFAMRPGIWSLALLPVWLLASGFALRQAWTRCAPWIYWLAAGQLALLAGWLVALAIQTPDFARHGAQGLVWNALCIVLYGMTTYIGLVWRSRLGSENNLRVAAIDRTDALTGLSVAAVFTGRLDGAQKRARQFGYRNVLVGLQVTNLEQLVEEFELDSNELPLVAAARAISATLRDVDVAARVSNSQFVVLVEGMPAGKSLTQLATRYVASGLRGITVRGLSLAISFQCVALDLDGLQASAGNLLALIARELEAIESGKRAGADTKTSIHVISDVSSLSQ